MKSATMRVNIERSVNSIPIDILIRTLTRKSEAAFIRELQIGGNDLLDKMIEETKNKKKITIN